VLTFNEIIKLVTELNIYMPKASIRAIFDKVDLDKSGQLDMDEFMDFVKLLRERYLISLCFYFLLLWILIVVEDLSFNFLDCCWSKSF
jgi:EF hand